jgi:hypothetical protein
LKHPEYSSHVIAGGRHVIKHKPDQTRIFAAPRQPMPPMRGA